MKINLDGFTSLGSQKTFLLALVVLPAVLYTFILTDYIDLFSFLSFLYFGLISFIAILVIDKQGIRIVPAIYVFNSCIAISFIVVQSIIYPDSYGTTHMLGSWTDDSYFFALMADEIPKNLHLRAYWYEYTSNYSSFVKVITPFRIDHPADVIFFQACISTVLALASRKLAFQLTGSVKVAGLVCIITVLSPFYWMFGGVILIRDTIVATLFVLVMICVNDRRWILAGLFFIGQFLIRPTTALLSLALCLIYYFNSDIKWNRWLVVCFLSLGTGFLLFQDTISQIVFDFALSLSAGTSAGGGMSFIGRSILPEVVSADRNQIFLSIQNQPLLFKYILNGAYVFFYPFFSPEDVFLTRHFDMRSFALNLVVPIMHIWINAWFFTALVTRCNEFPNRARIIFILLFGFVIIGTYSMQGRHKILLTPVFYILASYGFVYSGARTKVLAYWFSGFLFLLQLARFV